MLSDQTAFVIGGQRRRSALSLAPLIDVTFILLIFFMVVTQFSRFVPVDVSIRSTELKSSQPVQTPTQAKHFRLRVRAEGLFELNDQAIGDLEVFLPILRERLDQARKETQEKPQLRVAPDPDVPMQLLVDTMTALNTLSDCGVSLMIVHKEKRP